MATDVRRPCWSCALALTLVAAALVLGGAGCAQDDTAPPVADRKFRDFQQVFPVLQRDCGFNTCHGSADRFFRVFGPGRVRLKADTAAFDGVTGDEASASFQSALAMIDAEHPERSLLLKKPLALEAGGATHGGADPYGRNVYRTVNDEGYIAIARFVFSKAE